MIFAASGRGGGGFGVALDAIEQGLHSELRAADTGPCA
jgi:hypothetical protein